VIEVDFTTGRVRNETRDEIYHGQPIPVFMQRLVDAGGLVGYVRAQLAKS